MANVIISDAHLTDIADAIRSKNGTENAYKPREMAAAITAIEVGSGGDGECSGLHIPEETLVVDKDCRYKFAYGSWDWFIKEFGDKITTVNIGDAQNMFYNCLQLTEIPFDLNFGNDTYFTYASMFSNCSKLTSIGKLKNGYPSSLDSMFSACSNLRYLPEFVNFNFNRFYTYSSATAKNMFYNCNSLRSIPEDLLKQIYQPLCTAYYNIHLYNMFYSCHVLDEIRGLNPQTGTIASNMFSGIFGACYRLKDVIFATQEDGTPYKVNWKTQTIDFVGVGVSNTAKSITGGNSGITADKEVTDDASYQALKDNPDWFTIKTEYSRYNHDSAVNTINSLPDTSEYLASAGGTNTIKFKGAAGSNTDGGAINTLTEEEIAVAAAKGWTVTFA